MNVTDWISSSRSKWERFDSLLKEVFNQRMRGFSKKELRELGSLYRSISSDLAVAQMRYPNHDIRFFLNDLVSRGHQIVYSHAPTDRRRLLWVLAKEVPQIFRAHASAFFVALGLFLIWMFVGFVVTQYNPAAAEIFLDSKTIGKLEQGELWTERLFNVVPGSVASVSILGNNISVALVAFAGGLTAGVITFYVVTLNGLMLGVTLSACLNYRLHGKLLTFVVAHGLTEICAILVASMGGFMIARAILAPGPLPRRDALNQLGQKAIKLVFICVLTLTILGFVEGYLSPNPNIPVSNKIVFGLGMLSLFLLYLSAGDHWLERMIKVKTPSS
jgi:uncharacterized membrane protein SpoIIM required for sporulation